MDMELQRTCQHPKAVEQLREELPGLTLLHMFCPRCGMFFAREVWG